MIIVENFAICLVDQMAHANDALNFNAFLEKTKLKDDGCQDPDPKSHRSSCNTSYHFAASRTVTPRVPPYLARDRLRILAHVYDSVASIHMTENPGRHD